MFQCFVCFVFVCVRLFSLLCLFDVLRFDLIVCVFVLLRCVWFMCYFVVRGGVCGCVLFFFCSLFYYCDVCVCV